MLNVESGDSAEVMLDDTCCMIFLAHWELKRVIEMLEG